MKSSSVKYAGKKSVQDRAKSVMSDMISALWQQVAATVAETVAS